LDTWQGSAIGTVSHLRGTDGKILETWTGATFAGGVLVAMGRVFVTGQASPGSLYRIDPTQAPGAVTTVASNLGNAPFGIAFDGARIWTANTNASVAGGNVSIVTPGASIPWTVTTVAAGFTSPYGALFDGANVWVTDNLAGTLLKLDASGAILQTVTVQSMPRLPVYDGTNIWVPNLGSSSVSVVRASTGAVLQTLTGNGLDAPVGTAFDGQRVLVTNATGNSVSLWKAADLTTLGTFPLGVNAQPLGACSDGVNFWIALSGSNEIVRF
jgi:DNA-binding beta-propeller fold protein YncE